MHAASAIASDACKLIDLTSHPQLGWSYGPIWGMSQKPQLRYFRFLAGKTFNDKPCNIIKLPSDHLATGVHVLGLDLALKRVEV